MTVDATESAILGPLLSDDAVAAALSDAARMRAMVAVEVALARAQARIGMVPDAAAEAIARAAESFKPDLAAIGESMAISGVPTIALVSQLRAAVGGEASAWVHWGATSQDIVDTALVLQLKDVLADFERRLAAVAGRLGDLAATHRDTVTVARTRSQQALPTTFGAKAAGWLMPLVRDLDRLAELRPRLLRVQLGGAAGTLSVFGDKGVELTKALAEELGLGAPETPWHTQRDGVAELASWLSLVTGTLGKMGQDLVLLAQSEVGEVGEEGGGGGSSTLPQKANPVAAETLVALARTNATLVSGVHQAMLQEQERGGPGWTMEWILLPRMLAQTGAALSHAGALLGRLRVDGARMAAVLEEGHGLVLAEAASFALSAYMPRPEAQALVKSAAATAADRGRHLVDVLAERSDAPVDWDALRDPANALGAAGELVDRAVAAARAKIGADE